MSTDTFHIVISVFAGIFMLASAMGAVALWRVGGVVTRLSADVRDTLLAAVRVGDDLRDTALKVQHLLDTQVVPLTDQATRTLSAVEQLGLEAQSRIMPLTHDVSEALAEAKETTHELRLQTQKVGEATETLREVSQLTLAVVNRVESPMVKALSAAAGVGTGLKVLVSELKKGKERKRDGG